MMSNAVQKKFNILAINLSVLHSYFDRDKKFIFRSTFS